MYKRKDITHPTNEYVMKSNEIYTQKDRERTGDRERERHRENEKMKD